MNAQPYRWTVEFFNEFFIPRCVEHLNEKGELLGTDNKTPLPPGSEIPYTPTDVGIVVFDGDTVLSKAAHMLTHQRELTRTPISSLDKWIDFLHRKHPPDLTCFYDTENGIMATSGGKLINYYEKGIPIEQLLAKGLPPNFSTNGGKILAAIVTTSRYPDLGAVVIKTSLDGISGSISHVREGRLVGKFSARYNQKEHLIETVNRSYGQGAEYMELTSEEVTPFAPFPNNLDEKLDREGETWHKTKSYPVRDATNPY